MAKQMSETLCYEIKTVLLRRTKINPSYSLRAFAKSLSLSPGYLSLLLSGKRGINLHTANRIISNLDISSRKSQQIQTELKSLTNQPNTTEVFELEDLDFYEEIEWYHYAILSLLELDDFEPRIDWIAKKLSLPVVLIDAAIKTLKAKKVLSCGEKKWTQIGPEIRISNKDVTNATSAFQNQMLERAMHALNFTAPEMRSMSSCTIAIDSELVDFARQEIKTFRRNLMHKLENLSDKKNTVYNISIQLYPVSEEENKK
ncbi:MAG: DUF4423 domain-containing protein [Bdellovibrionales bacterium]